MKILEVKKLKQGFVLVVYKEKRKVSIIKLVVQKIENGKVEQAV